jgi:viologen exporter family transport system permease protein
VTREPRRMGVAEWLRPYRAALGSRFTLMLQYRSAAVAGVVTQCWWGALKVVILTAFYRASGAAAPALRLEQAITYTWIGQALFALLPHAADPEVAQAVRSGAIAYDRLRPVDAYTLWYVRAAGWVAARVLPRALLLVTVTAGLLPVIGLGDWAWRPPQSASAAALFALALALAVLLSSAMLMLTSAAAVSLRDERGVVALVTSIVLLFSGNLLPLSLFPDGLKAALLLQPLAGLLDIPVRIYTAQLSGQKAWLGLGLQAFWTLALVLLGRAWLERALRGLEVNGG